MTRAVWSCHSRVADLADDRQYADILGEVYRYDSNVVNHAQVSSGDLVVIRDRHLIYGYGVVEAIDSAPGIKEMRRCPRCRRSGFSTRTSMSPRHRCGGCTLEFDEPVVELATVT